MGNNILFRVCRWIGNVSLILVFPALFQEEINKEASISYCGHWRNKLWCWANVCSDSFANVNASEQYYELILLLKDVIITYFADENFVWTPSVDELFSFKSYHDAFSDYEVSDQCDVDTLEVVARIWKTNIPSKIKVFAWRLMFNQISTRDQLELKEL